MVPTLPSPPLFEHLLFEAPLGPVAVLAALGVIALVMFNRRAELKRGVATACVLFAAAVGVWITAATVTTDRERITTRSRELVEAVGRVDVDAVGDYLADEVRLVGWQDTESRERILRMVEDEVRGRVGVTSARVVRSQAVIDGPNVGRTYVRVHVEADQLAPPYTWWRLDWACENGEWRVVRIEWLDGGRR